MSLYLTVSHCISPARRPVADEVAGGARPRAAAKLVEWCEGHAERTVQTVLGHEALPLPPAPAQAVDQSN
eukprot:3342451-Pyramimonas_sp.AAC.1